MLGAGTSVAPVASASARQRNSAHVATVVRLSRQAVVHDCIVSLSEPTVHVRCHQRSERCRVARRRRRRAHSRCERAAAGCSNDGWMDKEIALRCSHTAEHDAET